MAVQDYGATNADAAPVDTGSAQASSPLPLYGVAHSLGGGVLTLVETKRPGTFAVRISPSACMRNPPSIVVGVLHITAQQGLLYWYLDNWHMCTADSTTTANCYTGGW